MKGVDLDPGPRLTPDDPEMRVSFAAGAEQADALDRAEAILRREGVVVLDHVVDPAHLDACRAHIVAKDADYDKPDRARNLGTYPGRHTAPLVIAGPLADPAVFAPDAVRALDERLLGPDNVLESFGLLVSIPGAPDQGRHYDGLLFEENNLDRVLPAVALSVAMPLVRLDEISGTTAFWRRSHRDRYVEGPPDFAPLLPVGSAVIWDFRTIHSGRGNRGEAARPILFAVHSRDWWLEPMREWSFRYRKLQLARGVHAAFDKPMRDFTVRADIID